MPTADDDETLRQAVQVLLLDHRPEARRVSLAFVDAIDRHRRLGGCPDAIDGRCPAALAATLIIHNHEQGKAA